MGVSGQIGLRLKAARKAAGYRTSCAFAESQQIPISTYSQHENGKRVLNANMLLHYGALLGMSAGWLLSGEGYPFVDKINQIEKLITLENELFLLNINTKGMPLLQPIHSNEDLVCVDMHLLQEVLLQFIPLMRDQSFELSDYELIEFAIEVYNGVVTTTATSQDKKRMIALSVASLKRSVTQTLQKSNIFKEKVSA